MRHCSRNAIAGAACRNPDVLRSTDEKLSRGAQCSLQVRVLRFGLLQDGDVGVGVFPEGEEIFVGGERSHESGVVGCQASQHTHP